MVAIKCVYVHLCECVCVCVWTCVYCICIFYGLFCYSVPMSFFRLVCCANKCAWPGLAQINSWTDSFACCNVTFTSGLVFLSMEQERQKWISKNANTFYFKVLWSRVTLQWNFFFRDETHAIFSRASKAEKNISLCVYLSEYPSKSFLFYTHFTASWITQTTSV